MGDLEAAVGLDLTGLMRQLTGTARLVAVTAIGAAVDPVAIADATQLLADGDDLRDVPLFKDAVAKYKDATATAEGA